MKGAATGMTIVMNTHTATAMPAVADMNTVISIIMTTRAAVVKNTTTNTVMNVVVVKNTTMNTGKNVVVGMTIITGITIMCRGIRRNASAKFAIRTKNTAMYAAKV